MPFAFGPGLGPSGELFAVGSVTLIGEVFSHPSPRHAHLAMRCGLAQARSIYLSCGAVLKGDGRLDQVLGDLADYGVPVGVLPEDPVAALRLLAS